MNIIKVENLKSVLGFTNKLEVRTGYKKEGVSHFYSIVVIDADDIENTNSLVKLRGEVIEALLIPTKYKFTFGETKWFELIKPQLSKNHCITYY